MDSGNFYRAGSSVSTPLSGPLGYAPTFTSTPNLDNSRSSFQPAIDVADPYTTGPHSTVNQKLDHLLYLFHEEKKRTSELKGIVSTLTDEVKEMKKQLDIDRDTRKECAQAQRKGYKLPTDLSV